MKRVAGRSGRDITFEVSLGSRIRAARVAAGMTQRALGDAVGIAYQKLQKYELGQDRIAVSTLQRISRALGIHPGELFDDPMPKPPGATLNRMVVRRSIELIQGISDPRVIRQLLSLIEEFDESELQRKSRALVPLAMPLAPKVPIKQPHRLQVTSTRAVIDPLMKLLRQVGQADADTLAELLGQALDAAIKNLRDAT